jgi:hypothetical protein
MTTTDFIRNGFFVFPDVCFFPGKIRAPAHNSCVTPGFVHSSVRKHIPVDFTPSTSCQFLCFHTRARLGWV